jgi:cell division protein FtsB
MEKSADNGAESVERIEFLLERVRQLIARRNTFEAFEVLVELELVDFPRGNGHLRKELDRLEDETERLEAHLAALRQGEDAGAGRRPVAMPASVDESPPELDVAA